VDAEASVDAVMRLAVRALDMVDRHFLGPPLASRHRETVLSSGGAAVVMSYCTEERERALLDQLSDTAWPRGERRVAVHRLVELALEGSGECRTEKLVSALRLVDTAFGHLDPAEVEQALGSGAGGAQLALAAEAFGSSAKSNLVSEQRRIRQALRTDTMNARDGNALLQLRLQAIGITRDTLIREANSNGFQLNGDSLARADQAARIIGALVVAARRGDEQRLRDISMESMPLDERRALLVDLIRTAPDDAAKNFICKSIDPRLAGAMNEKKQGDTVLQSLARAAVHTEALGFVKKDGESTTQAVRRFAKVLGSARVRRSRRK
jgi:hypothetical protein